MTGSELTVWRKRLGLNKLKAAEALGIGRNYMAEMESGKAKIPKHIEYACKWLATRFDK